MLELKLQQLQLFAGEKTEEATPKRRQEARRKGQVPRSPEVGSAFVLLSAFTILYLTSNFAYQTMGEFIRNIYGVQLKEHLLTTNTIPVLLWQGILVGAKILIPLLLGAIIAGVAVNLIQTGFLLTTEGLTMKWERIDPVEGFKRIFSKRTLVELIKSLFKVTIVALVAYGIIKNQIMFFPGLQTVELNTGLAFIGHMIIKIGLYTSGMLVVLALFDYAYQRWEFNKSLRMSKEEIKEEYKQTEGNPQIKAKIKERMRALAQRRMMQEVPRADVVITNPTHFAVAIKYQAGKMPAPVVVAKGADLLAKRIKEIAREHGVVTVENKPLAQALYKSVEIGEFIPPELFQAVAEVLAYVYKLKGKI
ncbi:flagellar biosynthetic protein FlhB [Carboxydocella thermautotrophica]|nr:flagellar biosynthetic protein FlhB [Carboxydocella thermautotrophica]